MEQQHKCRHGFQTLIPIIASLVLTSPLSESASSVVPTPARVPGAIALKKDMQQRKETIRDTICSTDVEVIRPRPERASLQESSDTESDFRENYQSVYANAGLDFEQVEPAYRYGYELARDPRGGGSDWSAIEPHAKQTWKEHHQGSWDQYRGAIRYGWERARREIGSKGSRQAQP
jgi:hypothetical protein